MNFSPQPPASAGRRKISAFLENLARPLVVGNDLSAGYVAMAQDTVREQEALEWSEALIGDAAHAVKIQLNLPR